MKKFVISDNESMKDAFYKFHLEVDGKKDRAAYDVATWYFASIFVPVGLGGDDLPEGITKAAALDAVSRVIGREECNLIFRAWDRVATLS